jgi:hypothetical protein
VPLGNSVSCCELGFLLQDQRRGWDRLEVLLSLVYRLLRCLFGLLAVLVRSDLSKDVELLVLRHENQVPRRQVGQRPQWDDADRLWLTVLSRWPVGRGLPAGRWLVRSHSCRELLSALTVMAIAHPHPPHGAERANCVTALEVMTDQP